MNRHVDLFIIGVQKGSTSSLLNYLSQHPEIQTGMNTEFTYFLSDEFSEEGLQKEYERFLANFDTDQKKVVFKNVGILANEKALHRLARFYPEAKIIVLLRNPVERMYSSFLHARRRGWENLDNFNEAIMNTERVFPSKIAQRNCHYVDGSMYASKIKLLYSLFPEGNISVDISEEFNANTDEFLKRYLRKMEVNDLDFRFDLSKKFQVKKEPKSIWLSKFINNFLFTKFRFLRAIIPYQLSAKMKRKLKKITEREMKNVKKPDISEYMHLFEEDIASLEQLLGRNLNIWKK